MSAHNSRYTAYARAHGRDEESMLTADRERWPGGCMTGFIVWIGAKWREWGTAVGRKGHGSYWDAEHVAFDAWLSGPSPEARHV